MTTAFPRLSLLLAAVLFSTGGAGMKALTLDGWQRACFRSAIAAAFLWIALPAARRRPSLATLGVGALYAFTMVSFVLANTYATAATAIFMQSLAPVPVLLLSPLLLGEHVRRRDLYFMAALVVGFACLMAAPEAVSATAPDPRLGRMYAAWSCLGWSGTMLGLRLLARDALAGQDRSAQALAVGNALAAGCALPLALPVVEFHASDAAILGYLGVFQIGVAYACLARGLRQVPAIEASLLLMLEPVLNPIWTWIVHREAPHALTWAGGAVVMAATVVHALVAARARAGEGRTA